MDVEYIYVDSRTRDTSLYPNGNTYSVFLTNPIKNIKKIDLVSATVPNSMFNYSNTVTPYFLTVVTGGTTYNSNLYPGFYQASTLTSELASTNEIGGISLTFNAADGKFIFYNSSSFTISTASAQAAQLLGIPANTTLTAFLNSGTSADPAYLSNTTLAGKYIIKSPNVCDFTANEMVFLDIEEFRTHRMHLGNKLTGYLSNVNSTLSNVFMPINTSAAHAFAVVPMDVISGSIKTFKETTDYMMSVTYPHVVEKVSRLTVNWRDINGNLLNFNGANNNSFTIRVHRSDVPPNIERPVSLPPPVPLMGKPQFNYIVMAVLVIGLLSIILMKKQ
jgi:hypothetical protein